MQVHVSNSSQIPDHCLTYALSDPKDSTFRKKCDHEHDMVCNTCEELNTVLSEIEGLIAQSAMTQNDKDNAIYTWKESVKNIQHWKAHQLRTINQDTARINALNTLDQQSALIIQDWAMKLLPRYYRESQGDWFAKRGISWHISVVVRKVDNEYETQAFVQVVEQCSQDSACVVALTEHLLSTIKSEHPEITKVYYRQDNGGCYHSANTVLASSIISKRTGVNVQRMDFSDPQGGKAQCDRTAATMKNHARVYLNEGHNISTPQEFVEALLSHGGVPGVRVGLLTNPHSTELNDKMKGISKFNNFEFSEKGVRVWRAYAVGKGKLFPLSLAEGKL